MFYIVRTLRMQSIRNRIKPFEVQKTNAVNALRMDFKYAFFFFFGVITDTYVHQSIECQ